MQARKYVDPRNSFILSIQLQNKKKYNCVKYKFKANFCSKKAVAKKNIDNISAWYKFYVHVRKRIQARKSRLICFVPLQEKNVLHIFKFSGFQVCTTHFYNFIKISVNRYLGFV